MDIEVWLANNEPSVEFFAIDELINWDLPIENKRPIFESIVAAGHLRLGSKFVSGAIMDLQINKVTLMDDPFGFS